MICGVKKVASEVVSAGQIIGAAIPTAAKAAAEARLPLTVF